jgi:hypothetical protein
MSAPIKTRHAVVDALFLGYEARLDVGDETGLVVGYGRTEEQAINDLILQLGEVRR